MVVVNGTSGPNSGSTTFKYGQPGGLNLSTSPVVIATPYYFQSGREFTANMADNSTTNPLWDGGYKHMEYIVSSTKNPLFQCTTGEKPVPELEDMVV